MKQLGLPLEPIEVKFCPACGGNGFHMGPDDSGSRVLVILGDCALCKGTGVVPLEWDPETAEIGF